MPTAKELYPSKFLSAEDLETDLTVTITKAEMVVFPAQVGRPEENKLVVHFAETEKGLALNKTNFNSISKFTGEENSDNWPGKKITLTKQSVEYRGEMVDALRVKDTKASDPVVQKYWQTCTDMRLTTEEGRAHLKEFKGDFAAALAGLLGDPTPGIDELPPQK